MTALYTTNLETEANAVTPSGWTANGNFRTYTWSERGVTPISGANGVFSSDNQIGGVYTGIAVRADQAVRVAFRVPALTTAGFRAWALMLRSNTAPNNFYRVILETDNTALRLTVQVYQSGTTVLASSSSYSFAPAPGDLVHLEAFAVGTTISGRAWIEGTPRPDTISGSGTATASYATVKATDSAIASGYAGMQITGPSGAWFGGDNIVITDGAGGEDFYYAPSTTIPTTVGNASATSPNATITQSGSTTVTASTGNASATSPLASVSTKLMTDYIINNNGTRRAAQAVSYSWFPGGRIGAFAGITAQEGAGTTDANGRFVPGINRATGLLLTCVRNADATADDVYYEAFA